MLKHFLFFFAFAQCVVISKCSRDEQKANVPTPPTSLPLRLATAPHLSHHFSCYRYFCYRWCFQTHLWHLSLYPIFISSQSFEATHGFFLLLLLLDIIIKLYASSQQNLNGSEQKKDNIYKKKMIIKQPWTRSRSNENRASNHELSGWKEVAGSWSILQTLFVGYKMSENQMPDWIYIYI